MIRIGGFILARHLLCSFNRRALARILRDGSPPHQATLLRSPNRLSSLPCECRVLFTDGVDHFGSKEVPGV